MVKRSALFVFVAAGLLSLAPEASALNVANRTSPRSGERARRSRTDFIILHTTEGAPKGALTKLRKNGEAHYLVNRDGSVFRIVAKDRVAFHAGRSMWNGTTELDRRSIGIEVVGYHNKTHRTAQVKALKELIRQLRDIYNVPADRVLTHGQVAFGRPNRYHRYKHRGRKRCAMSLGSLAMRKRLGLGEGPARDPDVDAGRLRVADRTLFAKMFPKVKLTRRGRASGARRASRPMLAAAPTPARPAAIVPSPEAVSKVLAKVAKAVATATEVAKTKIKAATAPKVAAERAKVAPVQHAVAPTVAKPRTRTRTRTLAVARRPKPRAKARKRALCTTNPRVSSARSVAGPRYAAASTIYLLPDGRVRTGAQLAEKQSSLLDKLPKGTRVLKKKMFGGYVKARRAPSKICGASWRSSDTVYRFPGGKLVGGHEVNPARLPKATMVFCAA